MLLYTEKFKLPSGKGINVSELTISQLAMLRDDSKDPLTRILTTIASVVKNEDGSPINVNTLLEPDIASCLFYIRKVLLGNDFQFKVECPTESCDYGKGSRGLKPEFLTIDLKDELVRPMSESVIDGMFVMNLRSGQKALMRMLTSMDLKRQQTIRTMAQDKQLIEKFKSSCVGIIVEEVEKSEGDQTSVSLSPLENSSYVVGSKNYVVRPFKDADISTRDILGLEALNEQLSGGISLEFDKRCPLCSSYIVESVTKSRQIPFFIPTIFFSEAIPTT